MSELSSSEFFNQVYQHYQDEEYMQAFDMLMREGHHFSKQNQKLYFWRTCLAAKTGKIQQAIDFLEEAIEAGHWYPEKQLREETDLEQLQGIPSFENLVVICQERQIVAQTQATADLITVEPNIPPPWPLLIALHGHNSNAEVSLEHWNSIASQGWLLALPQSSQIIGSNAYTWSDFEAAEKEIRNHYAALKEQYTIDPKQVVIGGFSIGSGLAIIMALKGVFKTCGFIAVAPYLPDIDQVIELAGEGGGQKMRGYIIVGEEDEVCYKGAKTLATRLRAQNFSCELEVRSGLGHNYPRDYGDTLPQILDFIVQ